MFADETSSRSAASSKIRELPNASPRSAFRSMLSGKTLFLAGCLLLCFLRSVHGFRFDDLPGFFIVFEATARNLRKKLFADNQGSEPVRISVVGFDGQPCELGAHALVSDLAIWVSSPLPLHFDLASWILDPVPEPPDASHVGAARAAKKGAFGFHAVADDLAA